MYGQLIPIGVFVSIVEGSCCVSIPGKSRKSCSKFMSPRQPAKTVRDVRIRRVRTAAVGYLAACGDQARPLRGRPG